MVSPFLKSVVAFLLLTVSAVAQPSPQVLRGNWTATVGSKQLLRGAWSAQILPTAPNAANGSWVLFNDANQIVLEGTWSAVKSQRSWRGTWSARVRAAGGTRAPFPSGKVMSGTWRADMDASDAKTLGEMLQRTLQRQITGAWESRGLQGRWSLKGLSSPRGEIR